MLCTNCKKPIPPNVLFCPECGQRVGANDDTMEYGVPPVGGAVRRRGSKGWLLLLLIPVLAVGGLFGVAALGEGGYLPSPVKSLVHICKYDGCDETELYEDGYCRYHYYASYGENLLEDEYGIDKDTQEQIKENWGIDDEAEDYLRDGVNNGFHIMDEDEFNDYYGLD